MIRRLALALIGMLMLPMLALAQSSDIYTVRDIEVDEVADSVIEAQQSAFASAKFRGLFEMVSRVTLPEDMVNATSLVIDRVAAERIAAAVDVEEETRGAGRYKGRISVVYNPVMLRDFLENAGVPYTDQAAPLALVAPVADGGFSYAWQQAWPERSVGHIAPTLTSQSGRYSRFSSWLDFEAEARASRASRAIVAELVGRPGAYRVQVSAVTASGTQMLGTTETKPTLAASVEATAVLLDDSWKRTSVIRETERNALEATVLYTSLAEWNTLRTALARSPLVSEFKTVAVARDGAVVRFVFAGNGERLVDDLRDRGVMITVEESIGWVLSSAATRLQSASEPR